MNPAPAIIAALCLLAVPKPACSTGAICFSAEAAAGQEFRKVLSPTLEFVLEPGWTVSIVPRHPSGDCSEFASVVNAPYRAHRALDIDGSYEWTADDEVASSLRKFSFVTNCIDLATETARLNTVLWPYAATPHEAADAPAKLGTSRLGKGRLWITAARVSHTHNTPDDKKGTIEWMKFTVEIILPAQKLTP